jgi:hypothetical protein
VFGEDEKAAAADTPAECLDFLAGFIQGSARVPVAARRASRPPPLKLNSLFAPSAAPKSAQPAQDEPPRARHARSMSARLDDQSLAAAAAQGEGGEPSDPIVVSAAAPATPTAGGSESRRLQEAKQLLLRLHRDMAEMRDRRDETSAANDRMQRRLEQQSAEIESLRVALATERARALAAEQRAVEALARRASGERMDEAAALQLQAERARLAEAELRSKLAVAEFAVEQERAAAATREAELRARLAQAEGEGARAAAEAQRLAQQLGAAHQSSELAISELQELREEQSEWAAERRALKARVAELLAAPAPAPAAASQPPSPTREASEPLLVQKKRDCCVL